MPDVPLSQRSTYLKSVLQSVPDTLTMTQAERTKLAGVASGATANQPDADLKNRANHTGSQAQSTITNLVNDLAGKAAASHTHTTANITGLDGTLAALANKPETIRQLTDVPDSFATHGLKYLRINSAENAIEFATVSGGGGSFEGDEVTITQMMDDLKIRKVSPTLFHPAPGAGAIMAYIRIPTDFNITGVRAVCDSGSGTFTVMKNGVNLSGLVGQVINSTPATITATGTGSDNVMVEGDELKFTIVTSSTLVNVRLYPLMERRAT